MKIRSTDAELIDALKRAFNYKTDVEVAGFLGVEKQTVYLARKGDCPLGERLRFKIVDKVWYRKIENLALRCMSDNLVNKILEFRREQIADWAMRPIEDDKVGPADAQLLDLYKEHMKFNTDAEMAAHLGVKRPTLSVIRAGRGRMGSFMRLKIFSDVWGVDVSEVKEALESTDACLKMVNEYIQSKSKPEQAASQN